MRKIYREAIIGGIVVGVGVTIIMYLIQGEVVWAYLFTYPIFYAIAHLIIANLRERREAKKEKEELSARDV